MLKWIVERGSDADDGDDGDDGDGDDGDGDGIATRLVWGVFQLKVRYTGFYIARDITDSFIVNHRIE